MGTPYLLADNGGHLTSFGGLQVGEDLRWTTPLKGLLVGASHVGEDTTGKGWWDMSYLGSSGTTPYSEHSLRDWTNQFYGEYTVGGLRLASEYRRYWRDQSIFNNLFEVTTDVRGWYVSGSYRISKRLELGSYYSRFSNAWTDSLPGLVEAPSQSSPDRHLYDKVVTARLDLNRHWNLKFEGHFMDGYGSPGFYPEGFYAQQNPLGLKPKTNMLLIRTGWNF